MIHLGAIGESFTEQREEERERMDDVGVRRPLLSRSNELRLMTSSSGVLGRGGFIAVGMGEGLSCRCESVLGCTDYFEVVLAVGPGLFGAGEYQVRALSCDEVVVLAALE
jgi:hypothetical protein